MTRLATIFLILLCGTFHTAGQTDSVLEKFYSIAPVRSSRGDVEAMYGIGEADKDGSTWYYFPDKSIAITYSDGACTEDWLVRKDAVVVAAIYFKEYKPLSELRERVKYSQFRMEKSPDNAGEKYFLDDAKGVEYGVNEVDKIWTSLRFYPARKYSRLRCKS